MTTGAGGRETVERRLAAILAADVAGYSRLMGADEEGTLARLQAHRRELIDGTVAAHRGRIVKLTGDGMLVEFASIVEAVRCALDVQRGMVARNADVAPDKRIEFRIGLNLGDVIVEAGDIYGDGVNVAARLEALSEPGGICLARTVRDHIQDKLQLSLTDLGERNVKNIARPIGVFAVSATAVAAMHPASASANAMPAAIAVAGRDKDQPSVVIMPFDNLSGGGDEYFVDGVVEEITSSLSRVREFFVIARQSAFAYKGRFVDVRDVGRELGVTYVVEGTVRRGGDRLRISVQLVDAETRAQLWSDRYEGATRDIFEFQDRIAAHVAGAIHPAIRSAEIELSKRKPPNSLRAYDQVLRAYPKLWGHNAMDNKEAISILRQAIGLDESYGRAHALLAWCLAQGVVYLWSSDLEHDRACALEAVKAASASIDDDPTALTAAGAALSLLFDQVRAAAYIERALALDPNNAWAWARYGWVANYCDEPARARERFERALALSPLDPLAFNSRLGIAQALAMGGDWAGAARLAREVIDQNPRVTWAYRILAYSSAIAGDLKTAQGAVRELLAVQPNASIEQFRSAAPTSQVPRFFSQALEGLRQAGLPEK